MGDISYLRSFISLSCMLSLFSNVVFVKFSKKKNIFFRKDLYLSLQLQSTDTLRTSFYQLLAFPPTCTASKGVRRKDWGQCYALHVKGLYHTSTLYQLLFCPFFGIQCKACPLQTEGNQRFAIPCAKPRHYILRYPTELRRRKGQELSCPLK